MHSGVEAARLAARRRGDHVSSKRSCPVCGAQRALYLHTMHFVLPEASPLPASYEMLVCLECACAFADSPAQANDYAVYYQTLSKYEDVRVETGGGNSPADADRIEELATQLAHQLPISARILDVGCGNGGLLGALRRRGYLDLTGIDPAPACAGRVRALGFKAVNTVLPLGNDARSRLGGAPFDLVILSHVLEHVFDAFSVLESLVPLLADHGRLYIEVPDPTRYEVNQFPPLYFFDAEHINHFSSESLQVLAARLKLECVEAGRKSLRLGNGTEYPALFGLLRPASDVKAALTAHEPLYEMLEAYVDTSLVGVGALRDRILGLIGKGRPFVLWGAGSLAQRLVGEHWFPIDSLRGVVDRDSKKLGLRFAGQRIASPEEGLRGLPPDTVVLCAAAIATDAIQQEYLALGHTYPFHAVVA